MSGDRRQERGSERTVGTSDDTTAMQLQDADTATAALPFARPDSPPAASSATPTAVGRVPDGSDDGPPR